MSNVFNDCASLLCTAALCTWCFGVTAAAAQPRTVIYRSNFEEESGKAGKAGKAGGFKVPNVAALKAAEIDRI